MASLSREELYELVWSKPASELARELGISDVAIGKQCRALQVPRPSRGYWAKVAAGATPSRPPLLDFVEIAPDYLQNRTHHALAALALDGSLNGEKCARVEVAHDPAHREMAIRFASGLLDECEKQKGWVVGQRLHHVVVGAKVDEVVIHGGSTRGQGYVFVRVLSESGSVRWSTDRRKRRYFSLDIPEIVKQIGAAAAAAEETRVWKANREFAARHAADVEALIGVARLQQDVAAIRRIADELEEVHGRRVRGISEWITWARAVADRLDVTKDFRITTSSGLRHALRQSERDALNTLLHEETVLWRAVMAKMPPRTR